MLQLEFYIQTKNIINVSFNNWRHIKELINIDNFDIKTENYNKNKIVIF